MKTLTFLMRTTKEIIRDPINIFFGLGFPVIILLILTAIQANVPVPLFEINKIAPGITVFGLSFITLFASTIISKDRETAFLQRLYTTPLTAFNFIFGYAAPLIPIAVVQGAVLYLIAVFLGLKITVNIIYSLFMIIPISIFYIALGLLCGSILNSKQVGGLCGALLTNVSAFMSGIWFGVELVGGVFKKIAYALPFIHATELQKAIINSNYNNIAEPFAVVSIYTVLFLILAVLAFLKQMKKQ